MSHICGVIQNLARIDELTQQVSNQTNNNPSNMSLTNDHPSTRGTSIGATCHVGVASQVAPIVNHLQFPPVDEVVMTQPMRCEHELEPKQRWRGSTRQEPCQGTRTRESAPPRLSWLSPFYSSSWYGPPPRTRTCSKMIGMTQNQTLILTYELLESGHMQWE